MIISSPTNRRLQRAHITFGISTYFHQMNISLKNQRILVTGASRGIGRAIAKQLSQSDAEVIIHYNFNTSEADKLKDELQNTSFIESCDLSDPSQVIGFITRLVQKYGPILPW